MFKTIKGNHSMSVTKAPTVPKRLIFRLLTIALRSPSAETSYNEERVRRRVK